jgi:hypothetical protein
MRRPQFQKGDLVGFHSYHPPVQNISHVGLVMESKFITHAERGYIYEVVTAHFGNLRFDLPAIDFELIKRI